MYSAASENKYGVDVTKVTIKLTYWGLIIGIMSPGVILLVGYMLEGADRQTFSDPARQQLFFWIFVGLSVIGAVSAFFYKKTFFAKPIIKSEKTFAADFAGSMLTNSIIIYMLIESIGIFGLMYFFLGGDLDGLMLFCLISVIVFQLIRPRPGFVEETLALQERFVSEGKFFRPADK